MPNITVSYAEIDAAAAQLGRGREEITARLQGLQSLIAGLVSSGFVTDRASGRFHEAYTAYTQSAGAVIAQLGEIQSFLTAASSALQELDAEIASRVGTGAVGR